MEFVQPLKLVVDCNELVTDVTAVVDFFEGKQHGLDLSLAGDQHATFWRAWFVEHGRGLDLPS